MASVTSLVIHLVLRGLSPRIGADAVAIRKVGSEPATDLADKYTLSADQYPEAKCLDGSQGAYYFRPGSGSGKNKFYIFRAGGAFVEDLDSALWRSTTALGSSNEWSDTMDMRTQNTMGFSTDPVENPLLHNWNHVFVMYCDGMYYSSSNSTRTFVNGTELHFKGAHIMTGILDDLESTHGLRDATDVIIGGCSAGGLSTFGTVDWLAAHKSIPEDAKVAGLSCSGYYLDYNFEHTSFTDKKKFPFWQGNVSGTLSPECLAAQEPAGTPHLCLIPKINAPYVRTPIFMWNSIYDIYQLYTVLDSPCNTTTCAYTHSQRYRTELRKLWENSRQMGGFLDACSHHCADSFIGDVARIKPINGSKPFQAFAEWYEGYVFPRTLSSNAARKASDNTTHRRIWEEDESVNFPCLTCCPRPESTSTESSEEIETKYGYLPNLIRSLAIFCRLVP